MLLAGYGNVPAERTAHLIGMLLGIPVSAGFVDKAASRLDGRQYHLLSQVSRLENLGPFSADLVGILELVPVAGHNHLQDQHWLARGVPGGHVHCQHRCRLAHTQELGLLTGGMPGDDLLQDVVDADALASRQVAADPAVDRLSASQVGAFSQRSGDPPGDQLRGLAVLSRDEPPGQYLAVSSRREQRGHPGRGDGDGCLDQVSRLTGLIAVEGFLAGPLRFQPGQRRTAPDETALALRE